MKTLAEYIDENRDYLEDEALAVLEGLTGDDWIALLDAAVAVHGIGGEPGMSGGLMKTQETIEDYDTAMRIFWGECTSRRQLSDALVLYRGVQARKGQQRRDIAVLDLGDYRVVVEG